MIPASIQKKVAAQVAAFIAGDIPARHLTDINTMVINVGMRWRLVCFKPDRAKTPEGWQLVSHEKYNQLSRRR